MKAPQDILLRPLLTERTMWLRDKVNQYSFEVPLDANKIQIRQAIAALYPKVKVLNVNTLRRGGKKRRVRGTKSGMTKRTKRAIVTLAEGQTIELV